MPTNLYLTRIYTNNILTLKFNENLQTHYFYDLDFLLLEARLNKLNKPYLKHE